MIKVENLSKVFTKKDGTNFYAVDRINFNAGDGEIVCLLGVNGAGKTTLLRLISDLSKATSGRVLIKGNDVSRSAAWKQYTSSYIDKNFLIDFFNCRRVLY